MPIVRLLRLLPLLLLAALLAGPVSAQPRAAAASGAAASAADASATRIIKGSDQVFAPPPAPPALSGPAVDLRFEDTPVREVVHAILGDLLKLDYIVHPPVDGRVTVVATSQVAPDKAMFLLETALLANGLALSQDARGVYHVGKPEALRGIVPAIRHATAGNPLPPGHGAIVVPLRFIGAAEMANILRTVAPAEAIVRVDNIRNLIVMVGSRAQAEGWLSLVSTFDVNMLAGMSVGVFPLKYATVRDVEAALQLMTPGATARAPQGGGQAANQAAAAAQTAELHPLFGAIRVLPIERLNSVIVVTSRSAYLEEARRWIERLDRPNSSATEPRLHVYPVRNGSARHLGQVLNGIFGSGTPSGQATTTTSGVAPGLSSVTGGTATTARGGTSTSSGSGSLASLASSTGQAGRSANTQTVSAAMIEGNLRVVADELNNAILVYGSPAQFERIEEVLRRLDVPPTQVLIEASIVEVSLTDKLEYGLQWLFSEDRGNGSTGTSVLSRAAAGALGGPLAGFSYTLRNSANNVRAVLNALADKSLVKVISTPSLMVLDNHTAQIVVGNQQPIQSGETRGSDGNLLTTSIQYKDTGVALSVTPSVGAGDMVTMQINQAVTDVGAVDAPTGQRTFLQRQIESKVAVRSGESVVLGGLIRDNKTDSSAGMPVLAEIPVFGALFGNKTRDVARTELLIVITPRVARSDEDARTISRDLRERLRALEPEPASRGPAGAAPPGNYLPGGPSQ